MADYVIYTNATDDEVRDFVSSLPHSIAGGRDPQGDGTRVRHRLAWEFLSLVAPNFQRLSQRLPGDDGDQWDANTPEYLAYHKGPKSSRFGSGAMPNNYGDGRHVSFTQRRGREPGTGELSKRQIDEWWELYLNEKHLLMMTGTPHKEAQAIAAASAWESLKKSGAKTLLDRFGKRKDQILVDTGRLRSSLQPGFESEGGMYRGVNADQRFDDEWRVVYVGSNHPHAGKHHHGLGNMPTRRFWPKGDLPQSWWDQFADGVRWVTRSIIDRRFR